MILKFKELIYCTFNSHNEVLMRILGLRMKRKKVGNKVKTAKNFIDLIASKSYMSGDAYKMKFKNGSIINTRDMLYNELRKIEKN